MIHADVKTGIVINDPHYPFQDEKAINLVLGLAAEMQPDYFVINGDLLDMFKISKFSKDPRRGKRVVEEIELGRRFLERVANLLPNSEKHFIFGNHEYRFDDYLFRNAPELVGLKGLSIREQLQAESIGFKVHYSGLRESVMDMGQFLIGHFNAAGQDLGAAKKIFKDWGKSAIQGHVHCGGSYSRTQGGKTVTIVINYCLCDLKKTFLINPNWQHGFTIFRMSGKWYDIEPVPMDNYRSRYF